MPLDPRSQEVRAWIVRAQEDLRAAKIDLEADPALLADAAFHCQQAVEKALKASLVHARLQVPRTHDLRVLGDQVTALYPDLEPRLDEAAALTEYVWRFRYPGELFQPPAEEVLESLEIARRVVQAVAARTSGGGVDPFRCSDGGGTPSVPEP